ncbi:hypothetical protein GCM10027030_07870 [Luteococcus sediminum]
MSLVHSTEEGTQQMPARVFLAELARQAEIASSAMERAWLRASDPRTPVDDFQVLADLQAALFACIVISRILKPTGVRAHSGLTKGEAVSRATRRGEELRSLLGVSESSPLLNVSTLRDSLEHFDERIDAIFAEDWMSVSAWWIVHGLSVVEISDEPGGPGGRSRTLRSFFPGAGVLYFGSDVLDLYALDLALVELCAVAVPRASAGLDEVLPHGLSAYGGMRLVYPMTLEAVGARRQDWLTRRESLGRGVSSPPPLAWQEHRREPDAPPAHPGGAACASH